MTEHVHEWTRHQNVTTKGYVMDAYEVCSCGLARKADHNTPVSTPSGPAAGLEGQDATQEMQDATEAAQRRVAAYRQAVDDAVPAVRVRRVMTLADQEQAEKDATIAELRAEVERLAGYNLALVRESETLRNSAPKCNGECHPETGPVEDCPLHGRAIGEVWDLVIGASGAAGVERRRADAAEARVAELDALLRSMANDFGWVPDPTAGMWSVNQLRAILDAPKDTAAP